jgi:hypothetical protein
MSKKAATSKSGWAAVDYCIYRRLLRFTPAHGGNVLIFKGVPPDIFYGMPSGINLTNFIDIKLRGRYEMAEIQPPPSISYSTLNREYRVQSEEGTTVFKREDGDPLIDCDADRFTVWEQFTATYGTRQPINGQETVGLPGL